MRTLASSLLLPALLVSLAATGISATALAQPSDRFTMGNNVVVAAGEQVANVVTMGGNATIDGEVLGDVMTMGGNVMVTGHVTGDLVTLGGNATLADGAAIDGEVATMGGSLHRSSTAHVGSVVDTSGHGTTGLDTSHAPSTPLDDLAELVFSMVEGAVTFFLLFLLGLALSGGAPERFTALKVVIARDPVQVGLKGLGGVALAVVVGIVFAITVVGIPLAIALAITICLASYVGLAAVAAVIGLVLPIPSLKDRPVHQLAAGVGTLYVASLVPGAGGIALAIAAVLGLGALLRTRLSKDVPPRLEASGAYRDAAYPQAL
jgi:uncharacterized membrane protein